MKLKTFLIIFLVLLFVSISFSEVTAISNINGIDITPEDTSISAKEKTIGEKIVGAIKVFGTVASVAAMMVLGIKFMNGSVEDKAEYKKTLFPYFIGAIVFFGASLFLDKIYDFAQGIFN